MHCTIALFKKVWAHYGHFLILQKYLRLYFYFSSEWTTNSCIATQGRVANGLFPKSVQVQKQQEQTEFHHVILLDLQLGMTDFLNQKFLFQFLSPVPLPLVSLIRLER